MRLLFAVLLVGCASNDTAMDELLDAWVGYDLDRLVEAWGPPSYTSLTDDGLGLYTWRHIGSWRAPNNDKKTTIIYSTSEESGGGWNPTTSSGHTFNYWCDKSFTVNRAGVITSGSWRGNACD